MNGHSSGLTKTRVSEQESTLEHWKDRSSGKIQLLVLLQASETSEKDYVSARAHNRPLEWTNNFDCNFAFNSIPDIVSEVCRTECLELTKVVTREEMENMLFGVEDVVVEYSCRRNNIVKARKDKLSDGHDVAAVVMETRLARELEKVGILQIGFLQLLSSIESKTSVSIQRDKSMMLVGAKINGKVAQVMVDMGVLHNFIKAESAKRLGLKLDKGQRKMKTVNVKARQVGGVAQGVQLPLGACHGIGFKSVFLITAQPYIFSNGYQIRFNEQPCTQCKVGYIVPEWVDDNPTLSTIKEIYSGSNSSLPTTTIVLPLKPDKVQPVKQQLSTIHPEILLFLSKIKRLSVKEDNEDPRLNTVSAVSISSEINFATKKNIDADSFLLHLSANELGKNSEEECSYHMWRQRFPVRQENKVEKRMEVNEWVITLAFPNGQRLNRGRSSPGVYAFLPTEMVTNFPFIIQADFLLASSRETILLDNKWNQGILDCVPSAFVSAFISLVKSSEDAPVSSLPRMFGFIPVNSSPYLALNAVRETIKAKLVDENIVPCESYLEQKIFQKPPEVGRLMPPFWDILKKARKEGLGLHNLSSHGRHVLSSSFDRENYDQVLNFLGVKHVEDEWYAKCIPGSNLILGVSEELYLELLLFLAEKWRSNFLNTNIIYIPLLKCASLNGDVSLYSVNEVQRNVGKVLVSQEPYYTSWLIDWNREFRCSGSRFFVPKSTQEAIQLCSRRHTLLKWLSDEMKVESVNVFNFAALVTNMLAATDRNLAVVYVHFLYHCLSKNYLSEQEVINLCARMPIVDNYGRVMAARKGVLVPANGSKWVSLIGSNPWREDGFVELGEDYLYSGKFAGVSTPENELIHFLKRYVGASDVPDISPPDAVIPTMSALLTKKNTFLLLDWIRRLRRKGVNMPVRFLKCIKEGSWLKVSLNGILGYRSPSQSFLPSSLWGQLLQNESVLVDIPIIDQSFYGDKINGYKDELGAIGVMFDYNEACQFIGKHLMALAASATLTRANVVSILTFIKFLREKLLSPDDFIHSIREGRWLRTTLGYISPVGSVLFNEEWKAASEISDCWDLGSRPRPYRNYSMQKNTPTLKETQYLTWFGLNAYVHGRVAGYHYNNGDITERLQ
ncbi:hypothetical protein HYC85_004503 [Camellia sinensis]|uniref:Uncharacterized protein n=1 Tax=Camellia sinensis TaxID=4442 RepID=A0A7J7HZF8_CAMSI|nr:hypothetical protein HYC85_004503 [Camellia sinensis]